MSFWGQLSIIVNCIRKMYSDLSQLKLGQKPDYELLQLSHRLEKGLLIANPRPLWGWEKAYRINELIKQSKNAGFSTETANAVLSAFLESKLKSIFQEDRTKARLFLDETHYCTVNYIKQGGVQKIVKSKFAEQEQALVDKLFTTRHSCREFSETRIPNEIIIKAVELANRCPSACNRQPYRVYALEPLLLEGRLGKKLQYKGDRTIIISGDIRAYAMSEILDWIVSPTIFAAYLTLSLHSLGVGSCVVRKDLVRSSEYNRIIRELTGMDKSEQIILEMIIGYYKDEFVVPVSNRASADEIVKFV